MGFKRCPGSSAFAQPKIEMLPCPGCGEDVEVWSDEPEGKCPSCGRMVTRMSTQSCLDWCKYAKECLGAEKHKKYEDMKSSVRKEALVNAAADRFGWDEAPLALARNAVARAEQMLRDRPDADPNVVMAAVVLGFACGHCGESGTTTSADSRQTAQAVLEGLGYPHGFVRQVCGLLELPVPGAEEDANSATVRAALARSD